MPFPPVTIVLEMKILSPGKKLNYNHKENDEPRVITVTSVVPWGIRSRWEWDSGTQSKQCFYIWKHRVKETQLATSLKCKDPP